MKLNEVESSLHRSTRLVKAWGKKKLANGSTLNDLLSIRGVSLWEAMNVELALYLVPDSLANQSARKSLKQILIPYLRPIKYAFWKSFDINNSGCHLWPDGKTVLFLSFNNYLARDVFHPVIESMKADNAFVPILLSDNPELHSNIENVHSINFHCTKSCVSESISLRTSILKLTENFIRDKNCQSLFTEESIPLWGKVKQNIKRAFRVHASFYLPDIIAVASHILEVHQPSAIISIDTADPRTRIFSLLGKKLGIPTIQIQSGAVGPEAVEWNFLLDDVVMAQGRQSQDYFIAHGVPSDKIYITGSSRYDNFKVGSNEQIIKVKERFGIPKNNLILLLASSYSLEIFQNNLATTSRLLLEMKEAIFLAASKYPEVTLIVKPHPLESVEDTKALSSGVNNIVFAEKNEDIRPLISVCDAFFTFGSTATLDGIILDKPTICPAFPGWMISDNFIKTGSVPAPKNQIEIEYLLSEIVHDRGLGILNRHEAKRSSFLDEVIYRDGDSASPRIVNLIKKIINSTKESI